MQNLEDKDEDLQAKAKASKLLDDECEDGDIGDRDYEDDDFALA